MACLLFLTETSTFYNSYYVISKKLCLYQIILTIKFTGQVFFIINLSSYQIYCYFSYQIYCYFSWFQILIVLSLQYIFFPTIFKFD